MLKIAKKNVRGIMRVYCEVYSKKIDRKADNLQSLFIICNILLHFYATKQANKISINEIFKLIFK